MNPDHLKPDKRGKIMATGSPKEMDFAMLDSKIEGGPLDQGKLPTVPIAIQSDSPESKPVSYSEDAKLGLTESDEKLMGTDDKKPAARTHNTRGRSGIKKQRIEVRFRYYCRYNV